MSAPGYQVSRDPTAVIGTRTAAYIVDVLLFFVIFLALGPTPLSPLAEYSKVPDGMDMEDACKRVGDVEDVSGCLLIGDKVYFTDGTDTAVYSLAALAYFILVYVLWQGASGLTPGKLLFGLRTVGEDGRSPGPLKALIRSVLWIVDGLPCIPLVGFVTGLTSTGHRRVGDMAAKTFVVGKGDAGQPIAVPGMRTAATAYGTPTVYGTPGYASQVPSSAPWGAQPPGAPGAGAPGASPWGTPTPSGPQPPYGAAPMPGANPAPPAPSYGAPSPSGGYPAPPPPGATPGAPFAPPTSPTAPAGPVDAPPTTPMGDPAPDASAFGESSDPSDADLPSGETEPATSSSTSSGEAPTVDSSGSTPAGGATTGGDATVGDVEATDAEGASGEPASAQAEVGGETGTTPSGGAITEPGGSSPSANAPAGAAASGSDQAYNPQWDAARGAYIQWDPNRSRWLQWDDAAKEWKPI